jgi:predicted small lipoprotein YifL
MVPGLQESAVFRSGQTIVRLAAHAAFVGTLAAAFALGGCGRKGPLDPPPGSTSQQAPAQAPGQAQAPAQAPAQTEAQTPAPAPQDQSASNDATAPAASAAPTTDNDGRPIAPKGQKKKLPIDWLID